MADGEIGERQSFGNLARSLKKYGSTCNHVKLPATSPSFCRHEVEEGETLQGLALKYGVSMEQIRRANRLWSSDSLFVRETLLIPVRLDDEGAATSVLTPSGFSADSGNSSDSSPEEQQVGGAMLREVAQSSSRRGSLRASVSDQSDSSLSDFLCKIDSSIARTKHQVQKIQGSSQFCCSDEFSESRRKPVVSRLRQATPTSGLEVTTQGRKLRSSLQRLEQAQDEMFEL